VFLGAAFVCATHLFGNPLRRIVFVLGLATSGCVLMFFGHVENYTVLCLAIGAFTLTGLFIAGSAGSRWLILLPLGLALHLHVLGLTLVPAALYILLRGTPLSSRFMSLRAEIRWLLAAGRIALPGAIFGYLAATHHYFRFTILPLVATELGIESYTLFSVSHLLDYANLFFVLLPGIGVLLVVILSMPPREIFRRSEHRFSWILALSTLIVAFVLDPKLGMPRYWVLFAFPAIPLASLCYLLLLDEDHARSGGRRFAMLAIVLSAAVLWPRAWTQHDPESATRQLNDYIALDTRPGRSALAALSQYQLEIGDTTAHELTEARRRREYPEETIAANASALFADGRVEVAAMQARQAIAINPTYFAPWLVLSDELIINQKYDSALYVLQVAYGLNPYSTEILNNLGLAFLNQRDYRNAAEAFTRSARVGGDQSLPYVCLARVYQAQEDRAGYARALARAASLPDAHGQLSKELGDYYVSEERFEAAALAYREAVHRGTDSAQVQSIFASHPQLGEWPGTARELHP